MEAQQMEAEQRIMVVSHDPGLADVRKTLLEAAGYTVVAARNMKEVQEGCKKSPQVVMIGYSLPPAAKRQVWAEVRETCNAVPILELHKNEQPSIMADAFFHHALKPDDFLNAVRRLFAACT